MSSPVPLLALDASQGPCRRAPPVRAAGAGGLTALAPTCPSVPPGCCGTSCPAQRCEQPLGDLRSGAKPAAPNAATAQPRAFPLPPCLPLAVPRSCGAVGKAPPARVPPLTLIFPSRPAPSPAAPPAPSPEPAARDVSAQRGARWLGASGARSNGAGPTARGRPGPRARVCAPRASRLAPARGGSGRASPRPGFPVPMATAAAGGGAPGRAHAGRARGPQSRGREAAPRGRAEGLRYLQLGAPPGLETHRHTPGAHRALVTYIRVLHVYIYIYL